MKLVMDCIHFVRKFLYIKNMTVSMKFMLLFIALVIVSPGIMGVITFKVSSGILEKKVNEQITSTLFQIDGQVKMIVENVNKVSDLIFSSEIIQEELRRYKNENMQRFSDVSVTNNYLSEIARSNDYIHSISIIGSSGKNLRYGNISRITSVQLEKSEWLTKVKELDGKKLWVNTYNNENINIAKERNVLSNIRLMKDFMKEETTGFLMINVREAMLHEVYKSYEDDYRRKILIMTREGVVVSCSDTSLIGQNLSKEDYVSRILGSNNSIIKKIDGELSLITKIDSSVLNWVVVGITPYKYITDETDRLKNIFILISIACLVLASFFNFIFTNNVVKPVKRLGTTMDKAAHGDLSVRIPVERNDEISVAARSFNFMISRIETLISEVYAANLKKKEAEFNALQAQINPHFLYNTLESVNSMAKLKGDGEISDIVIALSKLLRLSINKGNEILTVREEIEQVDNYLKIQKMRYEDKFTVRKSIDENVLELKVIKLIIQPLVENAIYHGLELKDGPGVIEIAGRIEMDHLVITVKDDGLGMSVEKLQELNSALLEGKAKDNKIYGILNVNERIKLHFGSEFGLKYESVKNQGTSVEAVLPIIKDDRRLQIDI